MRTIAENKGTVGAVRGIRLRGIGIAASELDNGNGGRGVSIQHLRRVLLGERESDFLLKQVRARFPQLLAPDGSTWSEASRGAEPK